MVRFLPHLVARPLIALWLTTSSRSWRRRVMADDAPHVHAQGTDPDRVLLTGDGAAAGRGVRTHELGLPGFLARSLSLQTGRATDVEIVVTGDMTARTCLDAIASVDLFRFDAVVLSLGGNEALALSGIAEWRDALAALLDDLEERSPAATRIFVLSIPIFSVDPYFPKRLGAVVDRHARKLDRTAEELVECRPRMTVIPLAPAQPFEREGPHLYHRWAEGISRRISTALDPAGTTGGERVLRDEAQEHPWGEPAVAPPG